MPTPRSAKPRRSGHAEGRRRTVCELQLQQWMDDGGANPPMRREVRTVPCVWTPTALKARLEAQRAVNALARSPWDVSAKARSTLTRIVTHVERRILSQESAAEQLRELTTRLVRHRRTQDAIRRRYAPSAAQSYA